MKNKLILTKVDDCYWTGELYVDNVFTEEYSGNAFEIRQKVNTKVGCNNYEVVRIVEEEE